MNDGIIATLSVEIDKLAPFIPAGNTFTSDWLEQEYSGVTLQRERGQPSYRNEYRIVKLLIESYTAAIVAHRDKLELFIPACRIIKSIENSLKEIFNQRQQFKPVRDEIERILSMPL